ncbi:hypothetical protein SDC9_205286 [bioreactor metagenome]|uniref:Uncharacterized protein n=1 Tax=bioreactor metagenome TaxID=1076179 RepID=A0A645J3A6_9ZZZZ
MKTVAESGEPDRGLKIAAISRQDEFGHGAHGAAVMVVFDLDVFASDQGRRRKAAGEAGNFHDVAPQKKA